MTKQVSAASWAGKAAYEIIQITGRSGASAHATARGMVDELLDYGVNLASVDARNYVRQHFGLEPVTNLERSKTTATGGDRSDRPVRKERVPTSTASWIGMAAHEIDRITLFGASTAAELARNLARYIDRQGHDLLDTDPRANARLHFGPEAMAAKRKEREEREERRQQREARQDAFLRRGLAERRAAA